MTKKEWDALKAEGKLVELKPKDWAWSFAEGFTWFDCLVDERERNCSRARWLVEQYEKQVFGEEKRA